MASTKTKSPAKGKTKALTQGAILQKIAEETELSRKQVAGVVTSLQGIIGRELRSAGSIALFRLFKIKVVDVAARPAGEAMNPFTKEMQFRPAKPASKKVKVLALKTLKDMAK